MSGPIANRQGTVVLLNGAPRSGKSSIAQALKLSVGPDSINLGVDSTMASTSPDRLPGIGLRPGGERPDLEEFVHRVYCDVFDSIAAHAGRGLFVVSDFGLHDWYSRPLNIWREAAERLRGLPVYLIGVRCSLEVILERRAAEPDRYVVAYGDQVPEPVLRWEQAVHDPGWYDLEVDTSASAPTVCAQAIEAHIDATKPHALDRHR